MSCCFYSKTTWSCWISAMPLDHWIFSVRTPKLVLNGASRIFWGSSTQLVRWGAPPSCKCDTTPVNPANHTSWMRGIFIHPRIQQVFGCPLFVGFSLPSLELCFNGFVGTSCQYWDLLKPREKSPFLWVNIHLYLVQESKHVPNLRMDTTVWDSEGH